MRLIKIDSWRGIVGALIVTLHVLISLWDANLVHRDHGWEVAIVVLRSALIPSFFVASGIVMRARLARGRTLIIQKWLITIAWPYLLWGTIILAAEWVGRSFRNPVDTSIVDVSLWWTPIAWLWFLYVLAIFQLIALALRKFPEVLPALGMAGQVADALLSLPLLMHLCCFFLIFYAIGVCYGLRLAAWHISPAVGLAALAATAPLAILTVSDIAHVWRWPGLPAAVAGTVALCWLGQCGQGNRVLLFLGRRSMAIYVVHIFFIAAIRIVLATWLGVTSVPLLFGACLFAAFAGSLGFYALVARFGLTVLLGLGFPAYAPALDRPRACR